MWQACRAQREWIEPGAVREAHQQKIECVSEHEAGQDERERQESLLGR